MIECWLSQVITPAIFEGFEARLTAVNNNQNGGMISTVIIIYTKISLQISVREIDKKTIGFHLSLPII